MSLIRKTFKVDGVLTDMTSVKLSSSDTTFGVKRNDTGVAVVADDTAMTNISTGVYEYDFTDPAAGLAYTYSLEITYSGETYWIEDTFDGPEAEVTTEAEAKLAAVNEMLEAIHEYPVAALDTGGTSIAADAETMLDRYDERIQAEGWHQNTEHDIEIDRADVQKQALVIAAGAWTASSKRLESADAFATYAFQAGDQIYISGGTGVTADWYEIRQKVSDSIIQLVESISATDIADVTTTQVGWENAITLPADVLKADTEEFSAPDVTIRAGKLYDRAENTFSFSNDLTLELTRQLAFGDLTEELAAYITATAAYYFQSARIGGKAAKADLKEAMADARARANADDAEQADYNILTTADALRVKGDAGVAHHGRT